MSRSVHIELPDPFPPGARALKFVEGQQVLVFNLGGTLVAVENSCPHAGASLHAAKLEGQSLRCGVHGMRFDLTRPAAKGPDLKRYPIMAVPGGALLELPEIEG